MKWISFVLALAALTTLGCSSSQKKTAAPEKAPAVKSVSLDAKKPAPAAAPAAEAADTPNAPTVTCVNGGTKREISVVTKEGHCSVNYTKDGTTSEIASGSASSSKCSDVQGVVKGNLVKAGYTCN